MFCNKRLDFFVHQNWNTCCMRCTCVSACLFRKVGDWQWFKSITYVWLITIKPFFLQILECDCKHIHFSKIFNYIMKLHIIDWLCNYDSITTVFHHARSDTKLCLSNVVKFYRFMSLWRNTADLSTALEHFAVQDVTFGTSLQKFICRQ